MIRFKSINIRLFRFPKNIYNVNNYRLIRHNSTTPPNIVDKTFKSHSFPKSNVEGLNDYEPPTPSLNDKIFVAMSSGVDSSVTAALMTEKYSKRNVHGIYMANWSPTSKCVESEWNDVQKVCKVLDISCERVDFEKEYWQSVFQPMLEEYEKGYTPNPDVQCNKLIKFGSLLEFISGKYKSNDNNNKWWLATGHYARKLIQKSNNQSQLLRAKCTSKDQSYFLSTISTEALNKVIFPVGNYTKSEVREIARKFDLPTAEKPDSQGLCFVMQSQKSFREFLNDFIEPKPGNIVTDKGDIVGKHSGLWYATIGQKSSISMPQGDPKTAGAWFISTKNFATNELVIVKGRDNKALYSDVVIAKDWKWLGNFSESQLPEPSKLNIQYKALQTPNNLAGISLINDFGGKVTSIIFYLDESVRALAPGQNIVLYSGDRVVGCGVIDRTKTL